MRGVECECEGEGEGGGGVVRPEEHVELKLESEVGNGEGDKTCEPVVKLVSRLGVKVVSAGADKHIERSLPAQGAAAEIKSGQKGL